MTSLPVCLLYSARLIYTHTLHQPRLVRLRLQDEARQVSRAYCDPELRADGSQIFDEAQQRDGHDRAQKWDSHPWNHHLCVIFSSNLPNAT